MRSKVVVVDDQDMIRGVLSKPCNSVDMGRFRPATVTKA
jgi:hypothetical protein